ncbi:MAG: hypothetical protein ACF8GE_10505 [Phycisphaerales bacterium JB043]
MISFDSFGSGAPLFGSGMIGGSGGIPSSHPHTHISQRFIPTVAGTLKTIDVGGIEHRIFDNGPLRVELVEVSTGSVLGFVDFPFAQVPATAGTIEADFASDGISLDVGATYEVVFSSAIEPTGSQDSSYDVDVLQDTGDIYPPAGQSNDGIVFDYLDDGFIALRVFVRPPTPTGNGQDARLRVLTSFDSIYEVDVVTPDAINPVPLPSVEEPVLGSFEFGQGAFHAPSTQPAFSEPLYQIEPGTGTLLDTLIMSFPPGGNGLTSLEFVGGTLYAALSTLTNPNAPSSLIIIDTTTGIASMVGPMGFNAPTGGLAHDGTTMYTVNSGGQPAVLYTVDTSTGAAAPVGPLINVDTGAQIKLTGLEFGLDGRLYGLGRGADNHVLFVIDPTTAWAFRLGLMPALAAKPAMSTSITAFDTCPMDFARDGVIGGADLGLLLGNWGNPGATDLNGDGTTNGADLGLFLGAWGPCP